MQIKSDFTPFCKLFFFVILFLIMSCEVVADLVVIGGGCAGYSAALCATRNNVNVVLVEGCDRGGQLVKAVKIDNIPGIQSISGIDFMNNLRKQLKDSGIKMISKDCTGIDFSIHPFKISVDGSVIFSNKIIIATGKSFNSLGIESEKKFIGRGVSYCVSCDGLFYKGKSVCVIGSGDSAIKAAIFLSDIAEDVNVFVRGSNLKASAHNQDILKTKKNVKIMYDSSVVEINGDSVVESVDVRKNNSIVNYKVDGVFVMIGSNPNTEMFREVLELDEHGYIITDRSGRTNIKGIYAAGDVKSETYKQAIIALGDGYSVAMTCINE